MSPIASRYLHTLEVWRNAPTGSVDDYGQALTAPALVATVPGLIQPRSAREVASAVSGGAAIGSHVAYLDPLSSLTADCWIVSGGIRYDLVGRPADAGGVGHHYEVGLERIG